MGKPVIAIAMGDAAGIGPELVIRVLSDPAIYDLCSPFVIGDMFVMRQIACALASPASFSLVTTPKEARFAPLQINVLCPPGLHVGNVEWGKLDPNLGKAAAICLHNAFELASQGLVQGVVNAPMNKEAFHRAGYNYFDELTYLAHVTDSPDTFIMGAIGTVWTVAVTEHVPFAHIVGLIRKDRVLWRIRKMHAVLTKVMGKRPRIAVAALNVHGGEGGQFGCEEIDEISPAIESARAEGIGATGPIPADTVFVRALGGEFDGVVCMYHDQANIARKLQKTAGATLFMGLPVPCATTAHGTAFDKAGKGIADPTSLRAAVQYTASLCTGDIKDQPHNGPA